jgi:hypothetical protein
VTRLRAAVDAVREMDPLLLLLRWSLLTLLANANDDPLVLITVAIANVIALPRPRILCSPWFWWAAFLLVGVRQLATWHTIDDHIIVTTYWCLAVALALSAREVLPTLAASARLIVGLVFALAASWKLFGGQFIDADFFRYELLFDDRFQTVARWVGGTSSADLESNLGVLRGLLTQPEVGARAPLVEGPRNVAVAVAFTGWGAFIECAVAVAFLIPLRARHEWARPAALLAFAGTTYAIVPVGGFGTLLMLLGAAQATSHRLRMVYLAAGLLLLVWAGIWPLLFG